MTGRAPTMSASKPLRRLFLTGEGRGLMDTGDTMLEVELFVAADGTVKVRRPAVHPEGIDQQTSDNLAVRIHRSSIDQA